MSWSQNKFHESHINIISFVDIINYTIVDKKSSKFCPQELSLSWRGLNELASAHPDPRIAKVQRDGHCHEAVMW